MIVADYLKIFRVVKYDEDFKLLKSDVESLHKWCVEDYMKINVFKINLISFTHKSVSILITFWVIY
jgi:hypothetical protein